MKETITMDMVFRETGQRNSWALFSKKKGHQVSPTFYEVYKFSALERAKAWASSWNSIRIIVEGEDERRD